MYSRRESIVNNELKHYGRRPSSLVGCRVRLGISCEMVCDHQDILKPALRPFQTQKVQTNQIHMCCRRKATQWYYRNRRLSANTSRTRTDFLSYVFVHPGQ